MPIINLDVTSPSTPTEVYVVSGIVSTSGVSQSVPSSPLKIGLVASAALTTSVQTLDMTTLAATSGYPMIVEVEARTTGAYVKQGGAAVTLNTTGGHANSNARINTDEWRVITVDSTADAYISCSGVDTTAGRLVATRIDRLV